MYKKGKWQDRKRHQVTIRRLERVTDCFRRYRDENNEPKVGRVQYSEQVVAYDVYRMRLEQDYEGKPAFGHELWHRGAKVGQI